MAPNAEQKCAGGLGWVLSSQRQSGQIAPKITDTANTITTFARAFGLLLARLRKYAQ